MFPQLHALLPVRQEVCDPPAGGVWHVELEELVLEHSRENGVESRAEVHKQDPGICYRAVQMQEGVVKGHHYCIGYRPVGSVDELQWVQE